MLPRLMFFLILPLSLYGCLGFSPSAPGTGGGEESAYVPWDRSADSEALYHFGKARLLALEGDLEKAESALSRAIELDPDAPFLRTSLIRLYLELSRDDLAVKTARELLDRSPENVEVRQLLADLYFNRQQDAEAIEQYRRILEMDPDRESTYLHLAMALARTGNPGEAIETIKELRKRNPESLHAQLLLARLYRETGLDGLAEEIYKELLEDNRGMEPAYRELGGIYENRGDIGMAIDIYEDGIREHPRDLALRHHVARLYILQENLDRALSELKNILNIAPDNIEALRKTGLIYMERNQWERAVEVFSTILDRNPELDTVSFYLGSSLERLENWEGALEAFQQVSPEPHRELYIDAVTHMGYLYHRLGRTEEAVSVLEKMLQDHRGRPEHYSFLASLLETEQKPGKALEIIDRGMARHPKNVELIYHRGLILEKKGDRQGARKEMRNVLRLEPDHVEGLNFLAYAYAEKGENLQEALRMAGRALSLKDEPHIRDTRGWVYFKLGRFEEARRDIEKAAEALSSDPVVLEHLGDIYRALDLKEKARTAYERAMEHDPDNKRLQRKAGQTVSDGHAVR